MPEVEVSEKTRRKRNLRAWMIATHTVDTPNGPKLLCGECGIELTPETMTVGHWPVPDYLGGTRSRNNVRPECLDCNSGEGGAMSQLPAKLVWEIVFERATGFVYRRKMAELGLEPIHVSPNFGKVHRRAVQNGERWVAHEKNTPLRPRVWRQQQEIA